MDSEGWRTQLGQHEAGVTVVGEHALPQIAEDYRRSDGDAAQLFNTYFGSWAVVDHAARLVSTSPGFTGAYYHRSTGAVASSVGPVGAGNLGAGCALDELTMPMSLADDFNVLYRPPTRTHLRDVRLLCGASQLGEVEGAYIATSLLPPPDQPLATLEDALDQTAQSVARRFGNPAVLFSGGRDSAAIYLALREHFPAGDLQAIYLVTDHVSSGGTLQQAQHVSKQLDVDLHVEHLDDGWPPEDEGWVDHILQLMRHRYVNPINPYHALTRRWDVVLDGQNVDALLSMDSPKPLQHGSRLSTPLRTLYQVLAGAPYTRAFQESWVPRTALATAAQLADRLLRVHRGAGSRLAVSAGQPTELDLGTQLALGLQLAGPSAHRAGYREATAELLAELRERGELELAGSLRRLWWHLYPAVAAHVGGASNRHGNHVSRFVNAGPFLPHWAHPLRLRDAWDFKHDLSRYIADRTHRGTDLATIPPAGSTGLQAPQGGRLLAKALRQFTNAAESALVEASPAHLRDHVVERVMLADSMLARRTDAPFADGGNWSAMLATANMEAMTRTFIDR